MKKARMGQNFLTDPSIAQRIVDVAGIDPDDTVVEIGAGHGIMTRILAHRTHKLITIELDRELYRKLRDYAEFTNVTLVNADALKYDFGNLEPFKVVANIPYYITTPIIFKLIEEKNNLISMTLTIQNEVAERIIAAPGNKQYGVLSLMVQYYGTVEKFFTIPAGAFTPKPKVDSAVIRIQRHATPPVQVASPNTFFTIIRTSFAGRRKMIANTLKTRYQDIRSIMEKAGIDPRRRPETLSMDEFASLANKITEKYG